MKPGEVYSLRMALLNAGHVPVPIFPGGRAALILRAAPSEGVIRSWANAYEGATRQLSTEGARHD